MDKLDFDFEALCKTPFKDVPVGGRFILRNNPHFIMQRTPDFMDEQGFTYNAKYEGIIAHINDDNLCLVLDGEGVK